MPGPTPQQRQPSAKQLADFSKRRSVVPVVGQMLYREADLEVEDENMRLMKVIASDESVDRYGDIIRVAGWELGNFIRNPVLLFGHQSYMPPIGTVPDVGVKGKRLMAQCKFLAEGVYDWADTIWRIVEAKALRAVSVGFIPLAWDYIYEDKKDPESRITGYEFTKQDLLELSIVPVPANANALSVAKSLIEKKHLNPEIVSRVLVEESASAFHTRIKRELDLKRLRASSQFH